jgi:uncharacterized UPF0160 family protein
MSILAATHSGPFHADDVLAFALIRVFHDPHARILRTRDAARMKQADLVFDVGGAFDPHAGRFDHHQSSYEGPLSSAGMILDWLESRGEVEPEVASRLRADVVDYVDAVDNGRLVPDPAVPCFARMVQAFTQGPDCLDAYDRAFLQAVDMACGFIRGIAAGVEQVRIAREAVLSAMDEAVAERRAVVFLDRYYAWKPVYYAHGGAEHPTDFVLFPGMEGTWRVLAIAPREDSFDQKRPLPESWAGLTGSSLEAATGVKGSIFCHKNRFIAVFRTRDAAVEALKRHRLMWRDGQVPAEWERAAV